MPSFEELSQRYQQLRSQFDTGNISNDQFTAEVQKLRTQDPTGTWWAINPEDGSFLRYDGSQWISPEGTASRAGSASAKSGSSSPRLREILRPLMPIAGLVLSTSCGVIWSLYSMLRMGQGEKADFMTPFILGGLPIALWVFRKPIGVFLQPLQPILGPIPRPILLGAAFMVPIVLGVVLGSLTSSGYGAMRFSAIISILGAYVLTRRPQVQP